MRSTFSRCERQHGEDDAQAALSHPAPGRLWCISHSPRTEDGVRID